MSVPLPEFRRPVHTPPKPPPKPKPGPVPTDILPGITDKALIRKIELAKKPVAVFFSMDGCPHCDTARPVLSKLAGAHRKEIDTYEIQAEKTEIVGHLGLQYFPSLLVFEKGREVKRIVGAELGKIKKVYAR